MTDQDPCQREEIAAYLDGELGGHALQNFEEHVGRCSACAGELRVQRQLLCTLEAAFSNSSRIALPENFSRVVAAYAESDLRGLREKVERRRALQLSLLLATAAFALLGAASGALVFQPARKLAFIVARISDIFWQTISDAAAGLVIILRMIGHAVVDNPYGFGGFVALVFVLAVSLLPRLIANYHRTQIIE